MQSYCIALISSFSKTIKHALTMSSHWILSAGNFFQWRILTLGYSFGEHICYGIHIDDHDDDIYFGEGCFSVREHMCLNSEERTVVLSCEWVCIFDGL